MNFNLKPKLNLSLIQTLSVIFVSIILLVITLSLTSVKGIERVGQQFNQLSEQALPLAFNNARLTQTILEQVKLLGYGIRTGDEASLAAIRSQVSLSENRSNSELQTLKVLSDSLGKEFAAANNQELFQDIVELHHLSDTILTTQLTLLKQNQTIHEASGSFRYGLSSIGPEMNRIASILAQDNPDAADAANRFISSASAMESTFLMLMMEKDLNQAQKYLKELKTRMAGIELAYDDFKEWHPDIVDFASLTAPFDMVKSGFKPGAVLEQILAKLQAAQSQNEQFGQVSAVAQKIIALLNQVSRTTQKLITHREEAVAATIQTTRMIQILAGLTLVGLILASWSGLRVWINRGLNNITHHLAILTDHDFRQQVGLRGPLEMKEITAQLNRVIDSTGESLAIVTRNCETLYQTAELSYDAAEQSNQSLSAQNQSLQDMVSTVSQLETSIREIASVTSDSYADACNAVDHADKGVKTIAQSIDCLQSLDTTLIVNEKAMHELDERVAQIRKMVDLISGIADNTNLLALNAAIEAARAGEQGRGFAVVADEVRKLASDTSMQTTNIRSIMNELTAAADQSRQAASDSRKEMSVALGAGDEVKATFAAIERSVEHIRARVEQITVATEEQERATADVSQAISHLSSQGRQTKDQLDAMVESSEQVADIAGHQQAMLHKYQFS